MKLLTLFLVLSLTGCANSGALSIGKDTYMTTVRVAWSGITGAKTEALATASADCESKGKAMLLGDLRSSECMLRGGCAEAQIVYSCLDKNDPRYKEPHMQKGPSAVIQIQGPSY
ncbi:hypothetical protein [Hydrogenophaga sp.]|uniref:hypothetical protein n=1 Tax=Hydrogenophaga sp. TaxID=1904254 RepID=UPI0027255EA7|nr:hypothetical protein [Hydrogenophaga sp.]MDO8904733.1 hypothetical protein [Hydrogenophaga sp.]